MVPYPSPRIGAFARPEFVAQTRIALRLVKATLSVEGRVSVGSVWTRFKTRRLHLRHRRGWQRKVYVCVCAKDYWSTVFKLLGATESWDVAWKFYSAPEGRSYHRPDKIVFYPRSNGELRHVIRRLRRLVRGCSFHALFHAASTAEFRLEASSARGLFIGSDPTFLPQSWRVYRTLCMAWLQLNKRYVAALPGGVEAWLRLMNLSRRHQGPASLRADLRNIGRIRSFWSAISSAE